MTLWLLLVICAAIQIVSGIAAIRAKKMAGYLIFAGIGVINCLAAYMVWMMLWYGSWPSLIPLYHIPASALIVFGQYRLSKHSQ